MSSDVYLLHSVLPTHSPATVSGVFQILQGFISVNYLKFFQLSSNGLRDHSYNLFKPQVRLHVSSILSVTVIDIWNSLPEELLQQNSG